MTNHRLKVAIQGPPSDAVVARGSLLALLRAAPGVSVEADESNGAAGRHTLGDPTAILTMVLAAPAVVELAKALQAWIRTLPEGRRRRLKVKVGARGQLDIEAQNVDRELLETLIKSQLDANGRSRVGRGN